MQQPTYWVLVTPSHVINCYGRGKFNQCGPKFGLSGGGSAA